MSLRILTTLTNNAYQTVSFSTNKGEDVSLTFRFIPSQETWYLDVESDKLKIRGIALTAFKNLLDPYHNKIDWGLYVWSRDGFDPWRIDDFATKRIQIGIIEGFENALIKEFLNIGYAS